MQNHTAANQQLTLIATGLGLDMSNALDSEHERLREKLQTLHGKAFDNQYMRDISRTTTSIESQY